MQYLIKDIIDLERWKQDPILNLATFTIKLVESDIYALKIRFNTLMIKFDANLPDAFSDADCTSLKQIQFQVTDPRGSFSKLEHKLTRLTNTFELVGGGMIYMYLPFLTVVNWFNDLRTIMEKLQLFSMYWPCYSQLVLCIPLPNNPYVLNNLPRILFLDLRLKLLLGIHLLLSFLLFLLEIRRRQ